jgi:hypothetical protein
MSRRRVITVLVIAAVVFTALFAGDLWKGGASGGGDASRHHFAEGQRWRFKTDVGEFQDTLVIGAILRLSELPMPPGLPHPQQKNQYWVYVRVNPSAPGARREAGMASAWC